MSDLLEYKCPCCGGAIEFNSKLQKMKCPYCDTEFDMEAVKEFNEAAAEQQTDDYSWENASDNAWKEDEASGMSVYICQSCGGEIVTDESTVHPAAPSVEIRWSCPASFPVPSVQTSSFPLSWTKRAAKAGLSKHLHGKILLPKVFKKENHIDEIKGVYVPFWLFDTDASADIRYHATKTRCWSDSDYDYTENPVITLFFPCWKTLASTQIPGRWFFPRLTTILTESLEPYVTSEAVDFSPHRIWQAM